MNAYSSFDNYLSFLITASEVVQTAVEDRHDTMADANGGISPTSVFVNSEPMREEQVQNAVKFLSHPKVRGSPVMYRRSFLEKKGLTKEEIDEAFRRVPVSKLFLLSFELQHPIGKSMKTLLKPTVILMFYAF